MRKALIFLGLCLCAIFNALSLFLYIPYLFQITLFLAATIVFLAATIIPFLKQRPSNLFQSIAYKGDDLEGNFYDDFPKIAKITIFLLVAYAIFCEIFFQSVPWDHQIEEINSGYILAHKLSMIRSATVEEFELYQRHLVIKISSFIMIFYYSLFLILKYNQNRMRWCNNCFDCTQLLQYWHNPTPFILGSVDNS